MAIINIALESTLNKLNNSKDTSELIEKGVL